MAGKYAPSHSLGPCPLCGREMIEGPSVNRHHWIPKSRGGQVAAHIHIICHRMLHQTFSEKELANEYATPHVLRKHQTIVNFVRWVRRKPTEFIDYAKAPRGRHKRRPQSRPPY